MNTRRIWICAVSLACSLLVCAACNSDGGTNCRRMADCPDDQFCQLGECVPLMGADPDGAGGRRSADVAETATDHPDADVARRAPCPEGTPPAPDELVLNEILPNVPDGAAGDANGDGRRDASDDEFVELVNRTEDRKLRLEGVRILEGGDPVASLDGVCLEPGRAVVVFGGLEAGAAPDLPDGVVARAADSALGLSNSGGSIRVETADGRALAAFDWSSAPPVSYTLDPQIDGDALELHEKVSGESPMSPGRCANGERLRSGCAGDEPRVDAGGL